MDTASTLDHWKLLSSKIFVGIRRKSTTRFTLFLNFIIPTGTQIRKFLCSFSKFFIIFLFIRIDAFDLIGASNFNFSSMTSHIVRMLAVLTQRIGKGCSDTALSQRSRILLFQHVFLFSQFFEPWVFKSLTCCDSIIRVVN